MRWAGGRPAVLVPVHAVEEQGVNAIPVVLAEALGQRLGWAVWPRVMQVNAVGHTGASGWRARHALTGRCRWGPRRCLWTTSWAKEERSRIFGAT